MSQYSYIKKCERCGNYERFGIHDEVTPGFYTDCAGDTLCRDCIHSCDHCGELICLEAEAADGARQVNVRLWESGKVESMHPSCAADHMLTTWQYDLATGCADDVITDDMTREQIEQAGMFFYGEVATC